MLKLSQFGEKFTQGSGIVELMADLGSALNENPDMIFMGGGNPGRVEPIEALFEKRLQAVLADEKLRHSLLGIYQSPQGDKEFRIQVAAYLKNRFGWAVSEKNIAVSNGSQSAFFVLYNMLAGTMPDGSHRTIHLPLSPEYLGYADAGLSENFFTATKPQIELLDNSQFKYGVDFSQLNVDESVAALCVSRPTNPTGNVLTDDEIEHLDQIAKNQDIPLIIDGAYGLPFPNITFVEASPHWNENTVLVLSLSKLGLPGVRTGIVVASEELIAAYTNANTISNLACGNLGPTIVKDMFASGEIEAVSNQHVAPFYKDKAFKTADYISQKMADLPVRIHKPEGAIFLWLWIKGLPITSQELYQRLKKRGVLIIPGHNFFIGMEDSWDHKHECVRISYAQDWSVIEQGVDLITEEIRAAFK